ncbi:MAG: hypothetical protein IT416_01785 [Candidatus Pacebacteria bacterium]|nr:hypothetical protein [Candidatus Paceibacterota bacterium]
MHQSLKVTIRKNSGLLWQGEALTFSSTNELGNFDILPDHAHFVSSIKDFIKITTANGDKDWQIDTGVLSVVDGEVEVFLGY